MKDKILVSATRRFARHGYAGTSLQAICDDVGIRKPSLLYHYPSKEGLREAVIAHLVSAWQTRLPQVLAAANGGARSFEDVFIEVAEFFHEDPNRARLILREVVDHPQQARQRLGEVMAPWASLLVESIKNGKKSGHIRADVDVEAWLADVVVLMVGTFAAAELTSVVSPNMGEGSDERVRRQVAEVVRMARSSLYRSTHADNETESDQKRTRNTEEST